MFNMLVLMWFNRKKNIGAKYYFHLTLSRGDFKKKMADSSCTEIFKIKMCMERLWPIIRSHCIHKKNEDCAECSKSLMLKFLEKYGMHSSTLYDFYKKDQIICEYLKEIIKNTKIECRKHCL